MESDREKQQRQDEPQDEAALTHELSPALQGVADGLAALVPAAPRIDRDRLMYEAGRAAAVGLPTPKQPSGWLWPLSTAALALVSVGLSAVIFSGAGVREQVVDVERGSARPAGNAETAGVFEHRTPSQSRTADSESYLVLRARVLAGGVDALPDAPSGSAATLAPASLNPRQELEGLLGS
jgi:hypothetical protein